MRRRSRKMGEALEKEDREEGGNERRTREVIKMI